MKNLLYLLFTFAFISCNQNSKTNKIFKAQKDSLLIENNQADTQKEVIEKIELKTVEDIRKECQSIMSKIEKVKIGSIFFEVQKPS